MSIEIRSTTKSTPSTIVKRMREHLASNGFNSISYIYLFVPCQNGIAGYIAVTDNEQIEKMQESLAQMRNAIVSCAELSANKPIDADYLLTRKANYQQNSKNNKSFYSSKNIKKSKLHLQQITEQMITEYGNLYISRYGQTFPNYYEFRGKLTAKQIDVYPIINTRGNGYIYFNIVERTRKKELKYALWIAARMNNYQIIPKSQKEKFWCLPLGNNVPFIYIFFERATKKVVYVGQSQRIETRIKRHANPGEQDSFDNVQKNNMNDNSIVKGYAFWNKYGNMEKTNKNFNLFKKFKLPLTQYEVRLLPLSAFKFDYGNTNNWLALAEAYTMHQIETETPAKIIYATPDMQLFNVDIKTYNVPLYHCRAEASLRKGVNCNQNMVTEMLKRNNNIINSDTFRSNLLNTLAIIRGVSFTDMSLYDIFSQYGLTYVEAMEYALGLSINHNSYYYDSDNTYYIDTPFGYEQCTKDVFEGRKHKREITADIIAQANVIL
jgi:hypothetical protein